MADLVLAVQPDDDALVHRLQHGVAINAFHVRIDAA